MAITAADIQNVTFSESRKGGYDVDEVDVFLEHVAAEIDELNAAAEAMQAEIFDLREQLEGGKAAAGGEIELGDDVPADAVARIRELEAKVTDLEAQLAEKAANDSAISQALIVAQRSADEVIANARNEASNIVKDADEEADRIVGKAESDRLRIAESIRSLENDRAEVRAEYRDMLANFMADAQKKLAEIDGDTRRANANAQARSDANAVGYAPAGGAGVVAAGVSGETAAVPAAKPAEPAASGFIDKDFSGYGAADDAFEFDVD